MCTPKNSNHVRSQQIRRGKQVLPKQNNLVAHHLNFIRKIHSLSNQSFGETMDDWTTPKYNFMKHTIVLGGSHITRCIPGFFVFEKFTLQVNLGDRSGGV